MDDIRFIGAVILIAATALLVLTEVAKRLYVGRLTRLLETGEVEEYLKLLDQPLVRFIFPAWNRAYMQLNGYLALDAYAQADRVVERMLAMRQTKAQRREIVGKAFSYYLERGKNERATELLHEMETWDDEAAIANARMMHDIYVKKGWGYIDELEQRVKSLSDVDRGLVELLLALQYENKGDSASSKRWLERSERDMGVPAQGGST